MNQDTPDSPPPIATDRSAVSPEISAKAIESIVEIQKQRVQNEAAALSFKERELSANLRLAEKSMDIQAGLARSKPNENKKTFMVVAGSGLLVTLTVLGFLGYCMSIGKEQFVIEFLKIALYPAVGGCGYLVGRKSVQNHEAHKNSSPTVCDAEIFET